MATDVHAMLKDGRVRVAFACSLAVIAVHLCVNGFFNYGIFRDELYYVACSSRPDWGYVDHPPFGMWVLLAVRSLFGDSLFALRLLPAFLHGGTIWLSAALVRRMHGSVSAVVLCCAAVAFAPIQLAMHGVYSMNTIEIVLWPAVVLMFLRALEAPAPRVWLSLGFLLGVMLLNKISALWLGFGLGLALLLPEHRAQLRSPWPWVAAAVALLMFLPYVFWNLAHDLAHLEFMRNASQYKYAGISRLDLLTHSILLQGPLSLPLWIAGAMFYLGAVGRPWRAAGVVFLAAVFVLAVKGNSKAEYLASAFPVLLAGGAVLIGRAISASARAARMLYGVLLLAGGVVLIPMALPVLPPPLFARYASALGVTHPDTEGHDTHELPQFFADMHGWEELARTVHEVYRTLPEKERRNARAIAGNYGEAGALEYFADRYALPAVIAPHNSYWLWGKGSGPADVYLVLRREAGDLKDAFSDVREAAVFQHRYCIPYENGLRVYVCRGLKRPWEELWNDLRSYI